MNPAIKPTSDDVLECFRQEALAAKAEYAAIDHAEKARWHALRWQWMDKAAELIRRQALEP